MAQIGKHHNEILPSHDKMERLECILDDVDFPEFFVRLLEAASSAEKTGEPFWVVRSGIRLGITTIPPTSSEGHRLGMRYLVKLRPRQQRVVGAERALQALSAAFPLP